MAELPKIDYTTEEYELVRAFALTLKELNMMAGLSLEGFPNALNAFWKATPDKRAMIAILRPEKTQILLTCEDVLKAILKVYAERVIADVIEITQENLDEY